MHLYMALDILITAETLLTLEQFLDRMRPPKEQRHLLDLKYEIKNQSVFLLEVRPKPFNEQEIMENPFAKITWALAHQAWKLY